jgi:hypothetical protein
MKRMILSIVAAGLIGSFGSAMADDHIHDRKQNQQKRIGEGVENGTLTPKETSHLENKEGQLNREIRHDRKQNGGNLTNNEKAQVNRQQNKLSRQIYRTKHDGAGK